MLNGLYQEILNLTLSSLAILPTPIVLGILSIRNVKWFVSRDFAEFCWILMKEMNANRFFWDSHWLEIWSSHFCPSIGPNEGGVAMDSA
jgi:hypothetical protein